MRFRKNRSKHFWVFSSYSLAFHLAGLLTLIILVKTQTPDSFPPPITVRLIDAQQDTPKVEPLPAAQKEPQRKPAPRQIAQALEPQAAPHFLPVQRVPDSSPLVRTTPSAEAKPKFKPLIQVSLNTLMPVGFVQSIATVQRQSSQGFAFPRVLVDHKAGDFLISTTPAKILYNPEPSYPRVARELGLQGKTLLRVEILQDGRPGAIKVRKSCGHSVLDEAATKAIKHWKFVPAHDGLFAVRSVVDLPIRFSLKSLG